MANIKNVAKKAGVGVGTVSRVINNSGYVKKETRDRVEQVIKETGFYSNEIAKSMASQKNNIVAFLLPNSTHFFFGKLIDSVENELYKNGYWLMLCNSSENVDKEIAYVELLKKKRVDGLILLTNNALDAYLHKDMPVITFDRRFKDIPFVASDNHEGGVMAARHLLEKGCQHFMFIGDDAQGEHSKVMTEVSKRRIGFIDELKKHGITNIINIEYPLGDYQTVPDKVYGEVIAHTEIDGIFCNNDNIAAEVVRRLEAVGRHVPSQVKVIGFDGGTEGFNLGKTITSINQDTDLVAKALVENLIRRIEGKECDERIIPIELLQGETT